MSDKPPRIELHLRSRKIIADGSDAIAAVRRPVQVLIYAIAACLVISSICLLALAVYARGFF